MISKRIGEMSNKHLVQTESIFISEFWHEWSEPRKRKEKNRGTVGGGGEDKQKCA